MPRAAARPADAAPTVDPATAEHRRLDEDARRERNWKRWGPYLSERAWGTVREDYSEHGTAWDYFPHDHARSRVFRWGEDGLAGVSDRHQRICFALALWNGRDPILKERLFGLTGPEGNHGEDVKEYWFYLDSTPTHSYMRWLYKYPQAAFPYERLVAGNRSRGKDAPELELVDTGVFDEGRYFEVVVEYAKASPEDLAIRIQATNRGPDAAPLHLLPTVWARNTWAWGSGDRKPRFAVGDAAADAVTVAIDDPTYGRRWLACQGTPPLLFTENESNAERLWGVPNDAPYVKDAFHAAVVGGNAAAVNPAQTGTKAAAHYVAEIAPGATFTVTLRLTDEAPSRRRAVVGRAVDDVVAARRREADEFYATVIPPSLGKDAALVMRQSLGGLLWSKQFFHYDVGRWLRGDPSQPEPPAGRTRGRNREWGHLYNADVISMPDKWEYPWYASWDLAFHCVALALVDPAFAKDQLMLFLREWYMHPNGQIPAYEWALGDVNPPVHAWAVWRVYKMEARRTGRADRAFLERAFHKLLLNFTWWVNRKDAEGRNVFQGGFLGLDNIGVFDRSAPLPTGGHIEQSDGTAWMGMYCLTMLRIAIELSRENPSYGDVASKFFEHFLYICRAMNNLGDQGIELWDPEDRFYYDVLHLPDGGHVPLRVRSLVGLVPLFAVETLDSEMLDALPAFKRRVQWFLEHRPDLAVHVESVSTAEHGLRRLLTLVDPARLRHVLARMLDETEFLSPYGIRALSKAHLERPYSLRIGDHEHRVAYEPAESSTGLFGGNSNWRGPIWFPMNFLLVESLQKLHYFLGDAFTVECPTGSGNRMSLDRVATEISRRLTRIFLRDVNGRRPVFGPTELFQTDPAWRDLVPFHEYFHGDDGRGVGASHQTGWTALVAKLLQQSGDGSGEAA